MATPMDTVKEFIIENFLFGDADSLAEDTSFIESGIVDSTGILEIVQFMEATFDIALRDEEVIPENLDCLKSIARFLDVKLGGGRDGPCAA